MMESVVLCEGYHDRAFWAGWLEHLGCANLGRREGKMGVIRVRDPWGDPVRGGEFAFRSRSGAFVRIIPCRGKDNLVPTARLRLKRRDEKALAGLVINFDTDAGCGDSVSEGHGPSEHTLQAMLQEVGKPERNQQGGFTLDDGETRISLVRWEASDADQPGLPRQQTLERLVCAALVAAYPDRRSAVAKWLDSRVVSPQAGPKEHAWSYMAGWYAEHGCEAFYRRIWGEDRVAEEVRRRLTESGAWRIAESLAE